MVLMVRWRSSWAVGPGAWKRINGSVHGSSLSFAKGPPISKKNSAGTR
jgi:hypothetical protein